MQKEQQGWPLYGGYPETWQIPEREVVLVCLYKQGEHTRIPREKWIFRWRGSPLQHPVVQVTLKCNTLAASASVLHFF